jgi:hypothetical protein
VIICGFSLHELLHEFRGDYATTGVEVDLHFTDFFINVFHELNNEVDKFMLIQVFQMRMRDQEAHIVALKTDQQRLWPYDFYFAYFDRFATHNNELLCTLHQKACKFMAQNRFDFISLLDTNRDPGRINARLNAAFFIFIPTNYDRIQQ